MQDTTSDTLRNRADRVVGNLALAELFLVQATIESASALSDGIGELRDHLYWDESESARTEQLSAFLKRTRDRLVEPYSTRFQYFRNAVRNDRAA